MQFFSAQKHKKVLKKIITKIDDVSEPESVVDFLPQRKKEFFLHLKTNCDAFSNTVNGWVKLSCDSRFQRAFTAYSYVFKVITLVGSNQGNYFENAIACSKRTLKTHVATQL